MGSVVWVQCATSAECNNLSIAESMVTDTLVVGHTMGQRLINFAHSVMNFALLMIVESHQDVRDEVLVVVVIVVRITRYF